MVRLGESKGYELIATTSFNAFFVKKSLFSKFGIKENSPRELFTESNDSYGRDTKNYALMGAKMNTLDYIAQKFKIDLNQKSPIYIEGTRLDLPPLFKELGYKTGAEIG